MPDRGGELDLRGVEPQDLFDERELRSCLHVLGLNDFEAGSRARVEAGQLDRVTSFGHSLSS